jgi:CRP-like cAMP-binding protein
MYILAQGQCEVLVKDQFKREAYVHDIMPGQLFGEVALLFRTKRTASVRCRDHCTIG